MKPRLHIDFTAARAVLRVFFGSIDWPRALTFALVLVGSIALWTAFLLAVF